MCLVVSIQTSQYWTYCGFSYFTDEWCGSYQSTRRWALHCIYLKIYLVYLGLILCKVTVVWRLIIFRLCLNTRGHFHTGRFRVGLYQNHLVKCSQQQKCLLWKKILRCIHARCAFIFIKKLSIIAHISKNYPKAPGTRIVTWILSHHSGDP